jgi:outer membrane PBP1 activator LpoA protein
MAPIPPAASGRRRRARFRRRAPASATPRRIGVLLPLSGPLAELGRAVRDGLLAGYYAAPGTKPELLFYDTAGQADRIAHLYEQALQRGADIIVGPLTKETVEVLARAHALPVPTLALNYSARASVPRNLYQFGLSPEDEARQVARQAWGDGHVRALALTLSGSWGDRLMQAFADEWERLGGQLVTQRQFDGRPGTLEGALPALLAAGGRYRTIPQPADFLFLAALPAQARTIAPLLRQQYGDALPVYTTSHSYGDTADVHALAEMEGIILCDMPWVLAATGPLVPMREQMARRSPESFARLRRFYALGMDAYLLSAGMDRLQDGSAAVVRGATGDLSADARGRIHRRIPCARLTAAGVELQE